MSYNLDSIIAEVHSDKTHRSRLAKRIARENYGVLSYSKREGGRANIELTKASYNYWVRKLKSSKPLDCNGPGELYCIVLANMRIYRGQMCNIVKVGRCGSFESRKKKYTGPDEIKTLIGVRNVLNMQSCEQKLIKLFKSNYPCMKNRSEYFLVPLNLNKRLTELFNSIVSDDIGLPGVENFTPTQQGRIESSSDDDSKLVMHKGTLYHRGNHGSLKGD
jgi:hypothetical protein